MSCSLPGVPQGSARLAPARGLRLRAVCQPLLHPGDSTTVTSWSLLSSKAFVVCWLEMIVGLGLEVCGCLRARRSPVGCVSDGAQLGVLLLLHSALPHPPQNT